MRGEALMADEFSMADLTEALLVIEQNNVRIAPSHIGGFYYAPLPPWLAQEYEMLRRRSLYRGSRKARRAEVRLRAFRALDLVEVPAALPDEFFDCTSSALSKRPR
jgi:hypothetical protein